MAKWLRIGSGGPETCPSGVLETIRSHSHVWHAQPDHPSFAWLRSLGIDCQPLVTDDLPAEGIVLLPLDPSHSETRGRGEAFERLVAVVDRLLGPGGCPWDIEQTHESLKKYLLEEAYEVIEAIDAKDLDALQEELGDLILQPLMHSQMEERDGGWGIESVLHAITDKLIRRHPHVFGEAEASTTADVLRNLDKIKRAEGGEKPKSVLGGIPNSMPALLRAHEVSKRAARVGFEWPHFDDVFSKLDEEVAELRQAADGGDQAHIKAELGDLLFTIVNIARWAKLDSEEALREMLQRFTARFEFMERRASRPLHDLSAQDWDDLWNAAKTELG
jgi:tetrapyrrole methylase family protein/MazG family protein